MLSPRERNIALALARARGRLAGRRNKEWACLISRVTTRERGDETPPFPVLPPVLFSTAARGNRRTNFAIRISISLCDLARTDAYERELLRAVSVCLRPQPVQLEQSTARAAGESS